MNTKSIDTWRPDIDLGEPISGVFSSDIFEFNASNRRIAAGLSGPLLLGLGSGISISAGFGNFGFSVLLNGVHQLLSLPLWFSQFAMTVLFFTIAWRWARIPLGMGTLPALLLVGPAISLGAVLTPEHPNLMWNIIAFLVGLFMFSFGITLSAAAALGPDGVTALSLAAEKRWRWPVSRANFTWNVSAIVLGLLLGGSAGLATIAGLLFTPVFIQICLPRLRQSLVY